MIVGIETGGTKVVCAAARPGSPELLLRTARFPTTTPDETIGRIEAFVREATAGESLEAVGLASFGPVDADASSPRFGWITTTPKPGWANVDLLGRVVPDGVPSAFVSDVVGAAVGELRYGAGRGTTSLAYATIGTGVGVGMVVDGRPIGGDGWPEVGHLLVRRHPKDDFAGNCPFHGDCLEGLTAGPAVLGRWGTDASSFPEELRAERLAILASYIAQMAYSVILTVGAQKLVLGGGVMQSRGLLEAVRAALPDIARGYGPASLSSADPRDVLVAPDIADSPGVVGALALAADLL